MAIGGGDTIGSETGSTTSVGVTGGSTTSTGVPEVESAVAGVVSVSETTLLLVTCRLPFLIETLESCLAGGASRSALKSLIHLSTRSRPTAIFEVSATR